MDLNRVTRADYRVPCRNALISVADKSGIDELAMELWDILPDLTIYSSGGTYRALQVVAAEGGKTARLREVSEYTGQPEMQGGLVKTLDFRIYLGLLGERYNEAHQIDIADQKAVVFDLTVCNFYPFEDIAEGNDVTVEDLRSHIDIGGPTMLRASAKNFLRVAALWDPSDYQALLDELRQNSGTTTLPFRADLAAKAFRYTSHYENAIAGGMGSYIRRTNWTDIYETGMKE
jgi:phosphoribosylaminoimidazolecarboxamide formyltransferase / IMP cyclohydrolase